MTDDKWAGKGFSRKNSESKASAKTKLVKVSLAKVKREICKGEKK